MSLFEAPAGRPGCAGDSSTCAKFIQGDNHFCASGERWDDEHDNEHTAPATNLNNLIVWGGVVANCGEHELSRLVHANCLTLQSTTYCPDRTKGGCLIRPFYHRGDRNGKLEFPELTDLSIRVSPPLLPEHYGWITPELKRLRLLSVISAIDRSRDRNGYSMVDCEPPGMHGLDRWLSVDKEHSLPRALHAACPKLESITVALCSTADKSCKETDWMELLPPMPLPWNVRRLLLLPLFKPTEKDDLSPLSCLRPEIVKVIFTFLGRSRWQYRDHKVPPSVAEELGLPLAFFCKLDSTSILDLIEARSRSNQTRLG